MTTALFDDDLVTPAGNRNRFATRWHMVSAGASDVWRYGDLVLDAPSGRLLLRGPNGTGKTTVLEALWPYLLDLNARQLSAGKARTTTLRSLMKEGASGRRRVGYLWLTFAAPAGEGEWSYGVRLGYSEATPVSVTPFTVPGRPLRELVVHGPGRATIPTETFESRVTEAGGRTFTDEEEYVTHLAARIWSTTPDQLRELATRLRVLRNPSLLADLSPAAAADALRGALPTVAPDVIAATADALAESDATREAFERDRRAGAELAAFAQAWSGHVADVVGRAHADAAAGHRDLAGARTRQAQLEDEFKTATSAMQVATAAVGDLTGALRVARVRAQSLRDAPAWREAQDLATLRETVETLATAATRATTTARTAVTRRHQDVQVLLGDLNRLADEALALNEQVANADPDAPTGPVLTVTTRPRGLAALSDESLDLGPDVIIDLSRQAWHETASQWNARAEHQRTTAAAATMARADHRESVAPALATAAASADQADRAREAHNTAKLRAHQTAEQSLQQASGLLNAVGTWAADPHTVSLRAGDVSAHTDGEGWSAADIDDLAGSDPSQAVAQVADWGQRVTTAAGRIQGTKETEASGLRTSAAELAAQAKHLREEATALRDGALLPLPRPSWAVRADSEAPADDQLLGAALDWVEGVDQHTADLLEAALAACGLLGARLEDDGARTAEWVVRPGPGLDGSTLADLVRADLSHPRASTAAQVLAQVPLLDTAVPGADLVIGRDGTFAAGPLLGRPTITGPEPASHIGARRRQAAARARAAALDADAAALDTEAARLVDEAHALDGQVRAVRALATSFPETSRAAAAEAARVVDAQRVNEELTALREAEAAYITATRDANTAVREWTARTTSRGLPADLGDLDAMETSAKSAAKVLDGAAQRMAGWFAGDLVALADRLETTGPSPVLEVIDDARRAGHEADKATTRMAAIEAARGAELADVVTQVSAADAEVSRLEQRETPTNEALAGAGQALGRVEGALDEHVAVVAAAKEKASRTGAALQMLVRTPGVTQVLAGPGGDDHWHDSDLVTQVGRALAGKPTTTTRVVAERYDRTRAELAETWALSQGERVAGLNTYLLTHQDTTYDPMTGSQRAADLAAQAQTALNAAEEGALRDFVIGRLPQAIGLAWTRLHDWIRDVNRKMKSASASSGLMVRVETRLREDLSPQERTVYELACKVADADRTTDQQHAVGAALTALIKAGDPETEMVDRISAAVDVRDWVRLDYHVDRGAGRVERWASKTGLSGGERRLVVLAPMLAAAAAGFDALSPTGLRLAGLDEVPAEVDERGREGLARFCAELDLDLIATSYLWDGAPGAWDGVDAFDLEAGSDQTVVAFPMTVRGLLPLPGDREAQ